jgi:8-oxo-dGTP pyrophosphatase MutT (NUDIX family)
MIQKKHVVTCFLENEAEILILRRSGLVGSFLGKWAGVSGYIETTADEQSLIEIAEETGLSRKDIKLLKKGQPLEVLDRDTGIKWVVHPYLFRIPERNKIKIDWEHDAARWIAPKDIDSYETVPRLKEALARVFGE